MSRMEALTDVASMHQAISMWCIFAVSHNSSLQAEDSGSNDNQSNWTALLHYSTHDMPFSENAEESMATPEQQIVLWAHPKAPKLIGPAEELDQKDVGNIAE